MKQRTIYIALLDEGTDVWRPAQAEQLPDAAFRVVSKNSDPEDEIWEFPPGSVVRCEERQLSAGLVLVAVALARE